MACFLLCLYQIVNQLLHKNKAILNQAKHNYHKHQSPQYPKPNRLLQINQKGPFLCLYPISELTQNFTPGEELAIYPL